LALTVPSLTVLVNSPRALPIATTWSPGRSVSLSPKQATAGTSRPAARSSWTTAMSSRSSWPTRVASTSEPSSNATLREFAPSTTWALVTT
jgi:hypothetical protein